MSLAILIDMNLSPQWVAELSRHGYAAAHWATVGKGGEGDAALMSWARDNNHIVFTHDLDFGALLALTHARGPSVLQVRGQNVLPAHLGPLVLAALRQHGQSLAAGAIVVVDERKSRVRVLPL